MSHSLSPSHPLTLLLDQWQVKWIGWSVFVLISAGCNLTEPNVSYDACLAGVAPCPEVCNGEDDDRDELVDEGLDQACVVAEGMPISPGEGFGRAVAYAGDVNGDGFADLLVSNTRAPDQRDLNDPAEADVALLFGPNLERAWQVKTGGDFGASIAVGRFGTTNETIWCAGAPTREGEQGVGRILCLDFEPQMVPSSFSSTGLFGLGNQLQTRITRDDGDQLLVSEPLWGGEADGQESPEQAGRILALKLREQGLEIEHAWVGQEADQRIGEQFIPVIDSDGDGVNDLLVTGFDGEGSARQVWIIDGSREGEVRRIQLLAIEEDSRDTFGASMAWGRFDREDTTAQLAFGSPYVLASIQGTPTPIGRVYFTSAEGSPLDGNSARLNEEEQGGYGTAMSRLRIEGGELLAVAGSGLVRILQLRSGKQEKIAEFEIPKGTHPSITSSALPDEDGLLRFWVGIPERSFIQRYTVRPAAQLAPQ